jgi:hypothetical protein
MNLNCIEKYGETLGKAADFISPSGPLFLFDNKELLSKDHINIKYTKV